MQPSHYNLFTPRPKKRSPRLRLRKLFSLVCVVVIASYSTATLLWPMPALSAKPTATTLQEPEEVAIDLPAYGQSAVYAPGYGLLDATNSDDPVPMASITKIVTALTVLDEKPLGSDGPGEMITFTQADVSRYNDYLARQGVVAPVTPDQSISQRDMLTITLIISASNYADSLAVWAFGSLDAYLEAANTWLAEHGLDDTAVADASGFSPDSRSTARDLVRLGDLALAEPAIAEAVDTERLAIEGLGTFRNTNLLLHADEDALGIKTGTTDEAGSCLLYAKEFTLGDRTITIIGATLNAPGHSRLATDAERLLNMARDGFQETTLADKAHGFAAYETAWGETIEAVPSTELNGLVWQGSELRTDVTVKDITNHENPADIGTVTITQGEQELASTELQLENPVEGPSWWWRLSHPWRVFES